jgi:hypothetical protein
MRPAGTAPAAVSAERDALCPYSAGFIGLSLADHPGFQFDAACNLMIKTMGRCGQMRTVVQEGASHS